MAVWICLPELPIKFYDSSVLQEIGEAIGLVLRTNSYTVTGTRASYAHLCIQLNLTKPLIIAVRVVKMLQKIMYEGISSLCFYYGRLGHKQENYSFCIQATAKVEEVEPPSHSAGNQKDQSNDTNFGEWMLVTKKKRSVQSGRGSGTKLPSHQLDSNARATKGKEGIFNSDLTPFNPKLTFQFKASHALGAVGTVGITSEPHDFGGSYMHKGCVKTTKSNSYASMDLLSSGHDVQSDHKEGQVNRKGKATLSSHERKSSHAKGKKSLKRPTPNSSSCQKSFLPKGSSSPANVPHWPPLSPSAHNGMGNMARKQGHCHPRRGDSPDQSCSDRHDGVVR